VIGLGLNLRCSGEVGAGMGTDGRLLLELGVVILGDVLAALVVSVSSVATPVPSAFESCLDFLFFPPIPADTSAKTLSGSPFSFLPCFEPELSSMPE